MTKHSPPAFQMFEVEDKTRVVYCIDKYNLPQEYFPWKKTLDYLKTSIKSVMIRIINEGDNYVKNDAWLFRDNGYNRCGYLASKVLLTDVPPICISEQILESFQRTDVPSMEPPQYSLPAFIFYLPSNVAKSISDDYEVHVLLVLPVDNSSQLDIVCITQKKHMLIEMGCDWNSSLKDGDSISVDIDFKEQCIKNKQFVPAQKPVDQIDKNVMDSITKIERIVKNAILTYTYETNYVKDANDSELTFSKGFKDVNNKPMPFRWLGKDFKNSVSKLTTKSLQSSEDSQQNRMRPHWRRGHWHNVCTGTKRKERQLRWFKPVFVNAG